MQLYPHIVASTIDLDEVLDTLDNIENYLAPLQSQKTTLYNSCCSFQLSNWFRVKDSDRYLAFTIMVNLNDVLNYKLRIMEGYYDVESAEYHEGDAFVDIKTERIHVESVVNDIKQGILPLWNRDAFIDLQRFSYVLDDSM